jgi:hypothetical protein
MGRADETGVRLVAPDLPLFERKRLLTTEETPEETAVPRIMGELMEQFRLVFAF